MFISVVYTVSKSRQPAALVLSTFGFSEAIHFRIFCFNTLVLPVLGH